MNVNVSRLLLVSALSLSSLLVFQSVDAQEVADPTKMTVASSLNQNEDETLNELLNLHPTTSRELMKENVEEYAASKSISQEQAMVEMLNYAKDSLSPPPELQSQGKSSGKGGHGQADRKLKRADRSGDIFVTSSWTGPVNHGHVGIYVSRNRIVEAPGMDEQHKFLKSRNVKYDKVKVYPGAVLQKVEVNAKSRQIAARRARKMYVGREYNAKGFAVNKVESKKLNCSQLVWLSYFNGAGVDLDSDGGPGVYPFNIYHSKLTKTYWTVQ